MGCNGALLCIAWTAKGVIQEFGNDQDILDTTASTRTLPCPATRHPDVAHVPGLDNIMKRLHLCLKILSIDRINTKVHAQFQRLECRCQNDGLQTLKHKLRKIQNGGSLDLHCRTST